MESEQEKISKSKLRMETREDKLNRARKKLEGRKPPKPRGPVRRVLGAALITKTGRPTVDSGHIAQKTAALSFPQ